MRTRTAVIIGAGIGGLSTAIRLQAAGQRTIIVEKNSIVGGKMSEYRQAGFRWDTGPSVITMRHVLEDLFQTAERRLEDYLTLLPVDPLTRYFFADGSRLDAKRDQQEMARQIEAIDREDIAGYQRYLEYAATIHRVTGPVFIYDEPPTLASFARVPIRDWLKADPFRTMDRAIRAHVRSPQLQQLLGRFATYVGGSPYEAPATLNVIADVELNGGVWYPQGGIYQIANALEKLAREMGVEIRLDCPVKRVVTRNGRAIGIETENQTVVEADAVIANADVTTTVNQLLEPGTISKRRLERLSNYEPSCSGFIMMLGVRGDYEDLAHHNIFFSADYHEEFKDIFKRKQAPTDPTIYVAITSKTDPDHAPTGYENWFILVNAPPLSSKIDWSVDAHSYRDLVLDRLAERGFDIRQKIEAEQTLTPLDLERMSGAWRGALYGPSANKRLTAFLRPHNRSKDVSNLYFVGGTTHPGGGVPMVMLSARVCAGMVLQDALKD